MVASVGALASAKTSETANAEHGGDQSQRPDGAPGRQRLGVQHAEVLGSLIVLAHRVGHASAGVHAAQRGADQRQEHRDRLSQHEVLAVALAQQRIADNDHHVADRRGGACRALHRIPRVQEVVGREVLKQVAEQPLNQQRRDDRNWYVLRWILSLAAHRGHRFEADQNQNRDRGLDEHPAELVHPDHRSRRRYE